MPRLIGAPYVFGYILFVFRRSKLFWEEHGVNVWLGAVVTRLACSGAGLHLLLTRLGGCVVTVTVVLVISVCFFDGLQTRLGVTVNTVHEVWRTELDPTLLSRLTRLTAQKRRQVCSSSKVSRFDGRVFTEKAWIHSDSVCHKTLICLHFSTVNIPKNNLQPLFVKCEHFKSVYCSSKS